jgi:fatty acid desaturase
MQAQTDPGFKLPADKITPDDPQPKTTPETATGPVEVVPGKLAPATDTSTRDVAIGGAIFIVLLVVYFFVRNAFVHHLVVRRVAPSSAGSAGWLLFVGLAFLSAAVVLAMVNAGKYLTFGVTAPLVVVGVVALVAALFTGRR